MLRFINQHRSFISITRVLIVLGVILASWHYGQQASRQTLIFLSFLTFGAIAVVLYLRNYRLWLPTIIIAGFFIPYGMQTGTQTLINLSMLLTVGLFGLWFLDMLLLKRHLDIYPSRTFLPLIALFIAAILSFAVGQLPWFAFGAPAPLRTQFGAIAMFTLPALAFILSANVLEKSQWLENLVWLFIILSGIYMIFRAIPQSQNAIETIFVKGSKGSLLWTWFIALAFSQALLNKSLAKHWRIILGLLVCIAMYTGSLLTGSWASGWMPPLIAILTILIFCLPNLGISLALLTGTLGVMNYSKILNLVLASSEQYSAITRWEAWRIVTQIASISPLFGLGPANYYWYTPLIPILGYYIRFNSHNQYVDIFAQTGIIGILLFFWFIGEMTLLALKLRNRVSDGFQKAFVYGALGGIAGMVVAGMLGDWVIPFVYNVGFDGFRTSVLGWFFLGGLVALEQIYRYGPVDNHS